MEKNSIQLIRTKINQRKDGYCFITVPKTLVDNHIVNLNDEYDVIFVPSKK